MERRAVRNVDRRNDEHAELVEEYPMAAGTTDDPRCRDSPDEDWECTRERGHAGIHVGHHNAEWIGGYWVRDEPTSD